MTRYRHPMNWRSSWGGSWTSTNFINPLATYGPNPFTPAGTNSNTGLDGDATRRANATRAGLPVNFFRANPDLLGGANVTGNGGYTRYNSVQIDVTKRFSHGLQFQGGYVYGVALASNRYSFRTPYRESLDTGDEGGITHAFKGNWVYELPFGRGRKFLSDSGGFVDRLAGGWSFDGVARITTGRLLDFGNVRVVGMSIDELRDSIKLEEPSAPARPHRLVMAASVRPPAGTWRRRTVPTASSPIRTGTSAIAGSTGWRSPGRGMSGST